LPARYRVIRHVANGGMASVWEAHDDLLDRAVAVKLLAPHLSEDERARLRFQREARTAAGLSSHPHVVTIYDVGEHDGRSFIVMELMRGGSVADRLRSGRGPDRDTALSWLREAASALDAAHERGVVHRDVKPANMLLDEKDRLALADFGIARVATEDQLTMTGQVLGTAAYISPEQAMGRPASDASDRYSLATVAYELLAGGRPFQAEHYAAQARAHVEDAPPRASERAPALAPGVDEVLERGMAKDPAERYLTASAFVGALDQALNPPRHERREPQAVATVDPTLPFEPVAARAPVEPGPAAEREAPRGEPPRREPPPSYDFDQAPAQRRRFPIAALAAILALVLAGGALALILSGGGGGDGGEGSTASGGGTAERQRERRDEATPTPTPTPEATAEREATAEPEGTATPEATATPTPEATGTPAPEATATPGDDGGEPDIARASRLNLQGDARIDAGDYAGAVEPLRGAVAACGDSRVLDPCGYAVFNLGQALNRSGNPEEAIPLLEQRLEGGYPAFRVADVRAELRRARRAADGS